MPFDITLPTESLPLERDMDTVGGMAPFDPEDPDYGSHYAAILLGIAFALLCAACASDQSRFINGIFAGIFGTVSAALFVLACLRLEKATAEHEYAETPAPSATECEDDK